LAALLDKEFNEVLNDINSKLGKDLEVEAFDFGENFTTEGIIAEMARVND
jgi:MOSC domain-containing protein YiiM